MGGRSGGGAAGGMGSGSRTRSGGSNIGRTEKGMSPTLARNIVSAEYGIKNNPYETLIAFDENGNETYRVKGQQFSVRYNGYQTVDKFVTHNHPRSLGKTGIASFGNSMSPADLRGMVAYDQAGMRAVAPNRTYSMRRPKGGWGVSYSTFDKKLSSIQGSVTKADRQFLRTYKGDKSVAVARLNATYWHRVNKKVAKTFGWEYTSKKNK